MYQPLADWIRPTALDDVVGQEHILGSGAVLRRLIDSGNIPNLIFYGPSGTGKTTVANIIAQRTRRKLYRLNATTASTSDIKDIVAQLDTLMAPDGVLLYLDEIQSFNKKQQQSLLEHIENGKITLIASTTENPYFLHFQRHSEPLHHFRVQAADASGGAAGYGSGGGRHGQAVWPHGHGGGGSHGIRGRRLRRGPAEGPQRRGGSFFQRQIPRPGELTLTLADAKAVAQRSAMRYDRDGDNHYDLLSALQKSIRGSDPDAAVHYLARLLEAGDMISACRRLMVIACEDVGLAYPQVIPIVKACVDAANMLGMPEARIPLGGCGGPHGYLAQVQLSLPGHGPGLAGRTPGQGRGIFPGTCKMCTPTPTPWSGSRATCTPHDFPNHWTQQQYLPDSLVGTVYYEYGPNKLEQAAKRYWQEIKKP